MYGSFINIIQLKRLLYFSFVLFLFKFCFLYGYGFKTALSFFDLGILTFSFISLFAAGYLFNYYHRKVNSKKKKPFPLKKAKTLSLVFSAISLILGVLLSLKIQKPLYIFIFIFGVIITYTYSKSAIKKTFLNNLIQSFLIPFAIICLWWFDAPVNLSSPQWDLFFKLQLATILYACVSFLSNLVRVLIIDIKNVDKDHFNKHHTIPILLGRKRAKNIILAISIFTCFFVFSLAILFADIKYIYLTIIILGTIPELYFIYHLMKASTKNDFIKLYKITNIVYMLGILSIPIIAYYFKYVIN